MNLDWVDKAPKYASQIVETWGLMPNLTEIHQLRDDVAVLQWSLQRTGGVARATSVLDAQDIEQYRIERERHMPYSRCVLRAGHEHIWTLTTRSMFRHRHELQFANGVRWTFKTPFFSVGLIGEQANDAVVVGGMDSEYR